MTQPYFEETLVLGLGMAGIACTRALNEGGYHNFKIITEDIGGRIHRRNDSNVNYGAFYFRTDYKFVKEFLKPSHRIRMKDFALQWEGKFQDIRRPLLRHPLSFLRLFREILKFDKHYQAFKDFSVSQEQKEYMEVDATFKYLYTIPALTFLKEKNIVGLTKEFIEPIVRGTTMLRIEKVSAAVMLNSLLILKYPAFEFDVDFEDFVRPIKPKIRFGTVVAISREREGWSVTCGDSGVWRTKRLIVALPPHVTYNLIGSLLPSKTNRKVNAVCYHVRGKLRSQFGKTARRYLLMPCDSNDIVVAHQGDDHYLVYCESEGTDLGSFFDKVEVVYQKVWKPAFYVGENPIPSDYGDGLLVIGDHNAVSMEDAFTTGLFAAAKIKKIQNLNFEHVL